MKREFVLNIILLVFINLLIKPLFIFGIDLGVQNRLGDQYGLYFALLNLTYLTQIINDFGIQSFNNRHISQHPHLLPKYFPNLLAIKAILSITYVLLTFLIAWLGLGYGAAALPLLLVLLLNQVLVQLILFLRSNISGLGYYRLDSLLSALDKFLMLITCGAILWGEVTELTLMSFAWAQTLALLTTAIVVFVLLSQVSMLPARPSWSKNWRAGKPALLMLFRQSMPYALVVLLMFAYTRLDAVLLERMAGEGQADVYAGAFRLLEACNMFGFLFASLLLPMFARLIKQKAKVRPLVSLSLKLIWAGSLSLSTAIFFCREDLLKWMMPLRATSDRFDVLGVLIWAFVPVSVTYIFSTLLTARERMMRMNRYFLIGIAIDLGLNLFLIPPYGALGAAIAALTTQVFISISMVRLAFKEFGFSATTKSMVRLGGFAAFVVVSGYLVGKMMVLHWGGRFGFMLVAGVFGYVAFGLINLKELKRQIFSGQSALS
ncbi:MAG: polysaccharide biosynthesis protein [Saprospiraceae bacterium]|nr:polysaccharide biosynthesis protein [Saprospiraceae bacterium]